MSNTFKNLVRFEYYYSNFYEFKTKHTNIAHSGPLL